MLALIADGLTDKEIATRLGINSLTIRSGHNGNLYSKIHVRNRTEAAIFVWRGRLEQTQAELAALRQQIAETERECKALAFYAKRLHENFEKLIGK